MSIPDLSGAALRWARAHIAPDADVELARMPGHSSGTYGLDVAHGGGTERLVLRLPPSRSPAQAEALLRQVRLLDVLGRHDLPVPRVRFSGDDRWFGTAYTIVIRLPGRSLGDVLADAEPAPADRAAPFGQAMAVLARVHGVDVARHLDGWGERLSLDEQVTRWDRMVDRYAAAEPAGKAVAALRAGVPADPGPAVLVHGDFYSNNWLFDGARLTGVLDWEASTIGPAATDLGWIAMMYDPESWDPACRPDIAVSPSPEAIVAGYGRPVEHLGWFRALAGVRMAALTAYFLAKHRSGERPDPVWERIARSAPRMAHRALEHL